MKKFILGLLLGAGLMLTGSIYAADITSLIGQAVTGTFPVQVNGTQIQDAIVVKDTSYLPARMIAELFNSEVSFIDNQVIVKAKDGAAVSADKLEEYKKIQDDKMAQWEKDRAASQKRDEEAKAQNDALTKKQQDASADEAAKQIERNKIMEEDAKKQQQQQSQNPQPAAN
jgi:flagellar biosynthesis GTPase FlhF